MTKKKWSSCQTCHILSSATEVPKIFNKKLGFIINFHNHILSVVLQIHDNIQESKDWYHSVACKQDVRLTVRCFLLASLWHWFGTLPNFLLQHIAKLQRMTTSQCRLCILISKKQITMDFCQRWAYKTNNVDSFVSTPNTIFWCDMCE